MNTVQLLTLVFLGVAIAATLVSIWNIRQLDNIRETGKPSRLWTAVMHPLERRNR